MMDYKPFSPVDIRFETLRGFDGQLSGLAGKRVLVLADEGTFGRLKQECPAFGRLINDQKNRLVTDIRSNPSIDDVQRLLNTLRHEDRYPAIIAIGGGSCIDLAKAVSALQRPAGHDVSYEELAETIRQKAFFTGYGPADIIAVPTTAGTGSEVTKWATVWDLKRKKKLSLEHIGCFAKAAVIVPELTESMPPKLTLSTGLDALSHAAEAFWAKARTPLSQALALDSIARVRSALPLVLKDPGDLGSRKKMSVAALLAGLAFSITKTTACHSISYPMTMDHGIPHGFAAALTLSQVMVINETAVPEISEIAELFYDDEGIDNWLADVSGGIQELKLSAFGIDENALDGIVQGAFTLGRMDNNPVKMEKETVKAILKSIL
jgi:phosphonate metabolism-associated iron-containing alcohol dehydrogenase